MKFSICIPAYKDRFLKECIESILSQTYGDYEIIICNDNSPFNITEIIQLFHDQRIRYYINEKGFGGYDVIKNWNKCLEYAKGEFVICMGDDDKLMPDCLANYLELISDYPNFDVYHTRTMMIDEQSKLVDIQEYRPKTESVYSMIWNLWKGRDQYIGDFLFRTSVLKKNGGFFFLPYAWSSDKITAFLMAEEKGIANTNSIGFVYRKSANTITNSGNSLRDRYVSLRGEKNWYEGFFSKEHREENGLKWEYYQLCKSGYEKYMDLCMYKMIRWDIQEHPFRFIYWLNKKNTDNISLRMSLKILHFSIYMCVSKIFHMIKNSIG